MTKIQSSRNSRLRTLASFAGVFLTLAQCAAGPVVLHLKNGDRISGEMVSEDTIALTVKLPFGGEIKVPKAEIDKREPSPAPASAQPASPAPVKAPTAETKPAPPRATTAPKLVEPSWYSFHWAVPMMTNWHGNVQLGSDMGFGTADHQNFYLNATATHVYSRLHNSANFTTTYGLVNNIEAANRMDGSLKTDVDLGKKRKLYVYNLFDSGYDHLRQIDFQYDEGAGLGYKLIEKPRFIFKVESGAEFQRFNYSTIPGRSIFSFRLGENFDWKVNDKLTVKHTLSISPNVNDVGDYRSHGTLGIAYPLLKQMTVNLNVIDDYDSQPPAGAKNNSLQIQTTVGVTF
jgi:hypothetical protein